MKKEHFYKESPKITWEESDIKPGTIAKYTWGSHRPYATCELMIINGIDNPKLFLVGLKDGLLGAEGPVSHLLNCLNDRRAILGRPNDSGEKRLRAKCTRIVWEEKDIKPGLIIQYKYGPTLRQSREFLIARRSRFSAENFLIELEKGLIWFKGTNAKLQSWLRRNKAFLGRPNDYEAHTKLIKK